MKNFHGFCQFFFQLTKSYRFTNRRDARLAQRVTCRFGPTTGQEMDQER
jgi:hypothetical protein